MDAFRERPIQTALENGLIDNWASDYAEPGYTSKGKGVLFANWNSRERYPDKPTRKDRIPCRLAELAEKLDYEIEWSDEWSTCGDCGKAVRTQADSYGWTASYVILYECELYCVNCVAESYLEAYLEELINHDSKAVLSDTITDDMLAGIGFERYKDGFENGFHPGQNDDPKAIGKELRKQGFDTLFRVDGVGQFDIGFAVYTRVSE